MRYSAIALLLLTLAPRASAQPLRVLATDTRPFFYLENGSPAGLEYEILLYFAKAQGRELEISWGGNLDDILTMLERGEADVAAATLTITPERQGRVDFSESYFPVRIVLVEPIGQKATDLKSLSGATLATMTNTTYEELLSTVPNAKLVYTDTHREMYELVASGKARALASDSAVALTQLQEFESLQIGIPLSEEQHYGFALSKGSPLTELLSEHIRQLKASGIYFRLLEQHLGARAVEVVKAGRGK